MAVYTVHEPPQRDPGSSAEPERFVQLAVADCLHDPRLPTQYRSAFVSEFER